MTTQGAESGTFTDSGESKEQRDAYHEAVLVRASGATAVTETEKDPRYRDMNETHPHFADWEQYASGQFD